MDNFDLSRNESTDEQYEDDIFKKWFKTGQKSGFLALNGWLDAGKVSVDIGEIGQGELKSSTKVWTNAIDLSVYLKAVYEGKGKTLYPAYKEAPTDESFIYYGGGKMDGKPVGRVLKVHHWQTGSGDNKSYDSRAFVWKSGHFPAKQTDSGAFIPDMNNPISTNLIKVSRLEMAQMHYRLNLAIQEFASSNTDFLRALNGNKR